jgi:HSP20 family protein
MDHTSHDEYIQHLSQGSSPTEGQLAVDVLETRSHIIVRAAIAGVGKEDLDISVTTDTLTIRGARDLDETDDAVTHVEECYWGNFSRSVVLPARITPDQTTAELSNGILTIRLKKAEMASKIDVQETK